MNVQAVNVIIDGLQGIIFGLESLKNAASEAADLKDLDPKDPKNKHVVGGLAKLTPKGAETCYRLFDSGKTRYAVCKLMEISSTAAAHRYKSWLKLGGPARKKQPLD